MRSIPQVSLPERFRERFGRRGLSILLALLVEALIVLILLSIAPTLIDRPKSKPVVFQFDLDKKPPPEPKPPKTKNKSRSKKSGSGGKVTPEPPVASAAPTSPVLPEVVQKAPVLWLSHNDYQAAEIKSAPHSVEQASNTPRDGQPGDSRTAGGHGPHGETLYAGDWYREPTDAELAPYLPAVRTTGDRGSIMCRTIAHYHVEDCRELGDSRPGSGIARGLRQAAPQFLIRPPRLGGKAIIGGWVVIDYRVVEAHTRE